MSAARIWQKLGNDQNSCQTLIAQLRQYREQKPPFDMQYNDMDTPVIWWATTELPSSSDHIQKLALLLFAISPYSSSCRPTFLTPKALNEKNDIEHDETM